MLRAPLASTRIASNGTGRVHVRPGGSGNHVHMGAGGGGHVHYVSGGKWQVHIYPYPNPGLTAALLDGRMGTVVHDFTQRVAHTYAQSLGARSTGKSGGGLVSSIEANVWPYWGYKHDRWVGEVKVGDVKHPYGAADEFGRRNPDDKQHGSTYDGSHALRSALYSVLPYPI